MQKFTKRKDGRYATSVIVGYEGNKAKRKIFYGKTIQELENKVAEFKTLKNRGVILDNGNITIGKWAEIWLTSTKSQTEYKTKQMYESTIKNHITPIIGGVKLTDIKKHHLQACIDTVVNNGHIRTAEIVRLTLTQLIQSAIDENYIYVDYSRNLTIPKKEKTTKRALTDAEEKAIDTASLTIKQRALITTLLCTGIRRGELLALNRSDVDLKNKVLHITKAVYFEGNRPYIKAPKSDAGVRDVPIPDKLKTVLYEYMKQSIGSSVLFPMPTNNDYMTVTAFRRIWEYIKTACKFPDDVTPHILRHTYATKLYDAGVDVKKAQYFLGHSSIKVTLDVYTHIEKSKAIEKTTEDIDRIFDVI